jgi:ABC-type multidrug transport system ATPase subunit
MKQKLSLIQAVLRRPEILILDEPFAALDATAGALTVNILRLLKAAGTTLIIASRMLSGIEGLVEDVLYINAGMTRQYRPAAALPGGAVVVDEAPREDYFLFLCSKFGNPEGKV